ncbi:MAG: CPBP family intramembrane metalloprotease [Gammaproteobacteria bacterium]|nr:MAG: CPBP family intramembrane metalloprotease [Gammaproteobacteria bacterium]
MHQEILHLSRGRIFRVVYFLLSTVVVFCSLKVLAPELTNLLLNVYPFSKVVTVLSGQFAILLAVTASLLLYELVLAKRDSIFSPRGAWKDYVSCGMGVIFAFIVFQCLVYFFNVPVSTWEVDYVTQTSGNLHLVYLTSGIIAPLAEELLYRYILPLAMVEIMKWVISSKRFSMALQVVPVLISSIVFALAHYGSRGFAHLIYFFVLALWLGYWVSKTSGISVSFFGHSLAGLLAVTTIYVSEL